MRINLGAILGLTAFAGLCYVTLAFPARQWQALLQNTMGGLLLLMMVAAIAGRGKARSYALGFGVASLSYVAVCFAPMINVRDKLVTHHVLEMAREHFSGVVGDAVLASTAEPDAGSFSIIPTTHVGLPAEDAANGVAAAANATASSAQKQSRLENIVDRFDPTSYFAAGHLLWAILLGFIGGIIGAALVEDTATEES